MGSCGKFNPNKYILNIQIIQWVFYTIPIFPPHVVVTRLNCFRAAPRSGTFDTSEAFFLRFRRVKGTRTASEYLYKKNTEYRNGALRLAYIITKVEH